MPEPLASSPARSADGDLFGGQPRQDSDRVSVLLPLPLAGAYGMTKAGLINLAEALRPELEAEGVTLQVVNPGFVKTPLTDKNPFEMPFLMEVEEAAAAFYDGLQSRRFEIIFPRRFAYLLKILRLLPYPLALAVTRKLLPKG